MTFWIVAALLTVVTVAALTDALVRSEAQSVSSGETALYREQLAELERERDALPIEEYETRRAEVGRRLLVAGGKRDGVERPRPAKHTALALMAILPVAALAVYLPLGHPDLPSQPFIAQPAVGVPAHVAIAIDGMKAHLAAEPGDLDGWKLLGLVLARLGRTNEWREALRHAIAQSSPDAPWGAELRALLAERGSTPESVP